MTSPLISLRRVSKTYNIGEFHAHALRDIDLEIEKGEFVAIMGPSGAGKSTLLHLLGCLDQPTTGSYLYLGRELSDLNGDSRTRLRRYAFGFVFQNYHLIGTASAHKNVELPGLYARFDSTERRARAVSLLRQFGLDGYEHRYPAQLSGGQKQRVSIARALMNGAQVILADEPTGALDSKTGAEVLATLGHLSTCGHTVVLVTHDRSVAAHAHRIIEMRDGEICSDCRGRTRQSHSVQSAPPRLGVPITSARKTALHGFSHTVATALSSLLASPLRSTLTLLGMAIGVASVVAMMGVGNGAEREVLERIESMGSNLMIVRPGAPNQRATENVDTLTVGDAEAIAYRVPGIAAAVPEQYGKVTARRNNRDYTTTIKGTTHEYRELQRWKVAHGAFFNKEDELRHAAVAALGQSVVSALFPDGRNPVGDYVLLDKVLFQIVGVMAKKGASAHGVDQDDVILMPYTTASTRLTGRRDLSAITIAVDDPSRLGDIEYKMLSLLYERHNTVDFAVRNVKQILEAKRDTEGTFTMMLGSIAGLSLLVGGMGVMNILLISVTVRTREIGVRMACGASKRHILLQFLIEALVVSLVGGFGGVAIGLAGLWAIGAFDLAVVYSITPALGAIACAVVIGLISGLLPARNAARLDPVIALGAE